MSQKNFKRSIDIPFDANNGTLAAAIMDLPGIHSDAWVFEDPPIIVSLSAGDKVCSARGVRSTIRFTRDAGDQPPFVVESALSTGARINNVTAVMETVQTLNCSCKGKCGGTFTLTYDAETTEPISFNATNGTITKALLALESLAVGDVSVGRPSSGSTFCMDDSNTSITVTFTNSTRMFVFTIQMANSATATLNDVEIRCYHIKDGNVPTGVTREGAFSDSYEILGANP